MAPIGYQQLALSDRSAAPESAAEPICGRGRTPLEFRSVAGMARWALVLVAALALFGGSFAAAEPTDAAPHDSPPPAEAQYDPLFDDEEPDPLFDDDFDFEIEETRLGFPDPLERMNRGTLAFNGFVDRWLLDPLTITYRFILPENVRRAITRALFNVNSTQVLVNDLFQLEWTDAGITLSRLVINSTAGIGGLFDPAANMGLERHVSDFGQTLAISGAPSGMYFMLPLLGPTTVRDGIGLGVDAFFHPTFYLLGGTDVLLFSGSTGLTERARHFEELKALEESSVDFYAAMRSGYYQNRVSEIWSRREHRRPDNHE